MTEGLLGEGEQFVCPEQCACSVEVGRETRSLEYPLGEAPKAPLTLGLGKSPGANRGPGPLFLEAPSALWGHLRPLG